MDQLINKEFNMENNALILNHLVQQAVKLYISNDSKVIFRTINNLLNRELHVQFPIVFTLVNLIDIGFTNVNDIQGSLNLSQSVQ